MIDVAGRNISGALTGAFPRRQLASRINGILNDQLDGLKERLIDQIAAQCLVKLPDWRESRLDRTQCGRLEDMVGHPVTSFCYPQRRLRPHGSRRRRAGGLSPRSNERRRPQRREIDPLAIRRIQNEEQNLTRFRQSARGFEEAKNKLRPAVT